MQMRKKPAENPGLLNFCDHVKSREVKLACVDCGYDWDMRIPATMRIHTLECPACWIRGSVVPNDRGRR